MVFHQLLRWHHFYDKSTPDVGLISDRALRRRWVVGDGGGLFLFADLQRRRATVPKRWWAGAFLGCGGFQLYDGVIQHKLLSLHQIRSDVDLTAYDLTWNALAIILVLVGVVLLFGSARAVDGRRP